MVILIFFIILLGLAGAGWWFLQKQFADLEFSEPTHLVIESGQVEKQTDSKWSTVVSGSALNPGDIIRTQDNSWATISLSNGSEIRLDANTQITLKSDNDHITLFQKTGRTWSRIARLLGVGESFEIESDTTLATVRGTAFTVDVDSDKSMVDTDDGEVEVAAIEQVGQERKTLSKIKVEKGFSAGVAKKDIVDIKLGKKQIIKQVINDELKNSDWFKKNRQHDIKLQEKLKNRGANPLQILKFLKNTSPKDLGKLQNLVRRVSSGEIKLTDAQQEELKSIAKKINASQKIDYGTLTQIANLLASLDPVNFSDKEHWKQSLRSLIPLVKKSGYQISSF